MSFVRHLLREDLTYWSGSSYDKFGDVQLSAATPIRGRWEDKVELFINQKGDQQQSKAVIYTDTSVAPGGYLYHGVSTQTDPEQNGADLILGVYGCDDVNGRNTLYKVFL